MKQIYFILAIVLASHCLVFGNGNQVNTASIGAVGEAVVGLPADFKNDLWLNTNYMEMGVGEDYSIVSRRVPEISSGSSAILPNFNYEVMSGASISVTANGLITANSLGTSVVKVTYDAITVGGTVYAACSDVNATYIVVDVIDESLDLGIEFVSDFSLRSYDTYYFTEGTSRAYTFSVTAAGATSLAVYCNGNIAVQEGDNFTVLLENRANIIEVVADNELGTKKLYYVADARFIEMTLSNNTNPSSDFAAGDEVSINFHGITIPVYKLTTIYNPTMGLWGGVYTKVKFDNSILGALETNDPNIGQYSIADHNQITFTLGADAVYEFSNGRIYEMWWGSALGAEKDMSGPGNPPMNAPTNDADFSSFPDFVIDLTDDYHYADFEDITLAASSVIFADASSAGLYETIEEVYTSHSYEFESFATNWGSLSTNFGFSISNETDNTTAGGVENMYNSEAGGDIDLDGNYAVVFDANSGGMSMGPQYDVKFGLAEAGASRIITGCYVTNNTYAGDVMKNGNGIGSQFGGADGTLEDWFKITAEGFDAGGTSTGTLDFFLADFRNEDSGLDYILEDWTWFDLTELGAVNHVKLSMSSSDVGQYGMNTPAYYCLDNIDKKRLDIQNPLADINAFTTDANMLIDLSSLYFDTEITDAVIVKTVHANTENSVVTASIAGEELSLDFLAEGETTIIIKGQSAGMMLCDTFVVNVSTSTITGPYIANALDDLIVLEDADNSTISLTDWAAVENGTAMVYSLISNSNQDLLSAELLGETLALDYQENAFGSAMIIVQATANQMSIVDTFMVEVTPVDDAPFVELAIEDQTLTMNAQDLSLVLNEVFTDIDGVLSFAVNANSNTQLVTTSITDDNLILSFASGEYGITELIIEASSDGLSVTDTFEIEVSFNTGSVELSSKSLQVYPNPCQNVLNVKSVSKIQSLSLINLKGQVLLQNTYSSTVDLSEMKSGVYILVIETESGILRKRIIKN